MEHVYMPASGAGGIDEQTRLTVEDLMDAWAVLSLDERVEGLRLLPRDEAEDFFLTLPSSELAELILALPTAERRSWLRILPPDDAADLLQRVPDDKRQYLLSLLDEPTKKEVLGLLAYAEDQAGGLMNPRYARLRPDMTVDEAISYLRVQARAQLGTIYHVYVVDDRDRLLGVVSLKQLFAASPDKRVGDVMQTEVIAVDEHSDQEALSHLFAQHDLIAIPVVDSERRIKGIVTVDDIVDVIREEATEDIQKLGGTEALDAPYMTIAFTRLVKKRATWLAALFLGEMLTATAMSYFVDEIARAVVLALFVPLIISSGGNSGSQASTLVIRAMALGEVKLRDWWRVVRRELAAGFTLGAVLGTIGFFRVIVWQAVSPIYGEHYLLVAATVFASLVGVVAFGTLAGSVMPFVFRSLRLDPASASAPFVATLVDVTGLVIYFTVASVIMKGTIL